MSLALDGVAPRSRPTDPVTSVDAGRAADLNASQQEVLALFRFFDTDIADHELVALAADAGSHYSPERIRSARAELVDLGELVELEGQYRKSYRGRNAKLHVLAPEAA